VIAQIDRACTSARVNLSEDSVPASDLQSTSVADTATTQTDLTGAEITSLQQTVVEHYTNTYIRRTQPSVIVEHAFDYNTFVNDDNKVKYYTGLQSFESLTIVFDFVREHVPTRKSCNQFQELLIVLAKLRLNLGLQDLAYRCNMSIATISRLLVKWLVAMDVRLSAACIIWPDRDDLRKTMPLCFKRSFGNKVAVIIDCFEIFVDRPSSVLARTETWSQYKHHNTVKFLIGVTPQGVISFVSCGWGGRVSDKHLTENSGLLDKLLPGDVVLADRGFTISDSVAVRNAELRMPAFTRGRDQLTALELEESRTISNVRIHVERVIGLVRQKYTILAGSLPIDFVSRSASHDVPLIDRIVRVCCSLCNLCESVIPFS
jgi:hypothetical protein